MPHVRLTHNCGLKGAEGYIGNVIEVTDEMAERLYEIGGAVKYIPPETLVRPSDEQAETARRLAAKPEAAIAEPAPEAAVEPSPAKSRKKKA